MSRSSKNNLVSPAVRFFEWSGSEGKLKWYDKATETNKFVGFPFAFLVLEQLNTAKGFDEKTEQGFWSNEVKKSDQILHLRSKTGLIASGTWKDTISQVSGVRFVKSVYIAFFDDNKELAIGNIQFSGASLGELSDKAPKQPKDKAELKQIGWFNFCKNNRDIESIGVRLIGNIEDKKGKVAFYRPIFARQIISENIENQAIELDKRLQEYLSKCFAKNNQSNSEENHDFNDSLTTDKQLLLLYNLANQTGYLELDIVEKFTSQTKRTFDELTVSEASKLIGEMKDLQTQIQAENLKQIKASAPSFADSDVAF